MKINKTTDNFVGSQGFPTDPTDTINSPLTVTMTWTKKHDEFALSCKFRPSTRLLAGWILRRAKPNQVAEIEIDLRVFNNWLTYSPALKCGDSGVRQQ